MNQLSCKDDLGTVENGKASRLRTGVNLNLQIGYRRFRSRLLEDDGEREFAEDCRFPLVEQ